MMFALRNQGRAPGDTWLQHTYLGYNYRLNEMSAALGLAQLQLKNTSNWTQIMAGTVLTALPMILVFLVMQRQFIAGMTAGAVKQ